MASKLPDHTDIRDTRGDPPLPTPPKFATGAAFYVTVTLKPCCNEVFDGEECGCDELIAQYLSAPVIWMGRRT